MTYISQKSHHLSHTHTCTAQYHTQTSTHKGHRRKNERLTFTRTRPYKTHQIQVRFHSQFLQSFQHNSLQATMKRTIAFTKAVNANNAAATMFESSRFDEAKETFQLSLGMMRNAMFDAAEESVSARRVRRSKRSIVLNWSDIPATEPRRNDQFASYVFCRVIRISSGDLLAPVNHTEVIAAAVFNVAPCCHILAMETNSAMMLKHAMQFYRIVPRVLMHGRTKTEPVFKNGTMIMTVILNNLGQIHFDCLLEYEVSGLLFEKLRKKLENSDHTFDQQDYRGFVLNVMLDQPLLSAAA